MIFNTHRFLAAACALLLLTGVAVAQRTPRGRARRPTPRAKKQTPPRVAQPTLTFNLSGTDITTLLNDLGVPPPERARLAADAQARKEFTQDLKEMFALADEARAAGMAARPETKLQLELARAFVVARAYNKKRQAEGVASAQIVTKDEISAFLKEPGQDVKFEEFLEDYKRNRPAQQQGTELTAAQRGDLQGQWANVLLASRKGVAAGLDKERATEVMIAYQHARLLAGMYFREILRDKVKATEPEIDAYLAAHPELNPAKAREKAEEVLRRVRAGEDFAALAEEFTDDPSGKGRGGDLGWFGRGMMVKPFEDAVYALKAGEVSGVVETQFGYHIIKLDERRAQDSPQGKPSEQVHARHILIAFPGGRGRSGQPLTPRENARAAVEKEKGDKLIDEIARRSRVAVAEDFQAAPAQPPPPARPRP